MPTSSTINNNASKADNTKILVIFALLVFLGYSTVGIPLAVLPLHVHQIGFGPAIIGLVVACQALATLFSRGMAGSVTDNRGAHIATYRGVITCLMAIVLYAISSVTTLSPWLSLFVLMAGRIVLGIGESLFITGVLSWSISTVGPSHAGKAMVWTGIAMFGAVGIGAPIGAYLYTYGFMIVSLVSAVMPILGYLMLRHIPTVPLMPGTRLPFTQVVGRIWPQGIGLAFSTMGFGTLFSFLGLYFAVQGWQGAPLGLTAFGMAYIAARLVFGGLPDKCGGLPVAKITIPCQCIGLALLCIAPSASYALIGCAVVGAGYSLTFPALGVDALRRVPPQNRGAAMGAYVAFVDIGLGATGLISGNIAGIFGYTATFYLATLASIAAYILTLALGWRARLKTA